MTLSADALNYARRTKETALRQMTVAQSIAEFLSLNRDFASMMEETEPLYRQARLEAMWALQRRLHESFARGTRGESF